MRKLIIFFLFSLHILTSQSQEKGKFRVGADIGVGLVSNGEGFTGGVNLKYNLLNNLNVGVKFGLGMILKDYSQNFVTTSLVKNLLFITDYYFYNGYGSFAPYFGGGIGYFRNQNIYADEETQANIIWKDFPATKSLGGTIRAGFELGKIRFSAEYYIIPSSTLYNLDLNTTEENSENSFINLSVGFYIGGGKWRK